MCLTSHGGCGPLGPKMPGPIFCPSPALVFMCCSPLGNKHTPSSATDTPLWDKWYSLPTFTFQKQTKTKKVQCVVRTHCLMATQSQCKQQAISGYIFQPFKTFYQNFYQTQHKHVSSLVCNSCLLLFVKNIFKPFESCFHTEWKKRRERRQSQQSKGVWVTDVVTAKCSVHAECKKIMTRNPLSQQKPP